MKKMLAIFVVIAVLGVPVAAFSQIPEPVLNENPSDETYWSDTGSKMFKGLANVAFGWTQVFQDFRTNDGSKNAVNLFLDGMTAAAARTIVGGVQFVTSPFPSVEWEGDAKMCITNNNTLTSED